MGNSKHQNKKSEVDNERMFKKSENYVSNEAVSNLPGIVQRATNDSTRRPGDILALQKTVGNRAVQQLITKKSQPGVVQRHVPPEADAAAIAAGNAASENWGAMGTKITGAKKNLSETVDLSKKQTKYDNTIITAFNDARVYEAEGGGETQSSQSSGETQSPQSGEDIYEGGTTSQ